MKKEESKIQSESYRWYNNNYCLKTMRPRGLMFSISNELGGRNVLATMIAKSMGLTEGVSDTIVILPVGKLLFVEFKTDTGRQSPSQKDFQTRVEEHGYRYVIVRSVEAFKELVEDGLIR